MQALRSSVRIASASVSGVGACATASAAATPTTARNAEPVSASAIARTAADTNASCSVRTVPARRSATLLHTGAAITPTSALEERITPISEGENPRSRSHSTKNGRNVEKTAPSRA